MRPIALGLAAALLLAACGKSSPQADALDNAAAQADPAAAAEMRNAADGIRENGSDANLSAPGSPAQAAMANAGDAAANNTAPSAKPSFGTHELVTPGGTPATPDRPGQDTRSAQPHKAGAPVPNTNAPTPVVNHY